MFVSCLNQCKVLVKLIVIFLTIPVLCAFDLDGKPDESICKLFCDVDRRNVTDCDCGNLLSENVFMILTQSLFCKNDNILSFKLECPVDVTYVVEKKKKNVSDWEYATKGSFSGSTIFSINNLEDGSSYKIRTWTYYNKTIYTPIETDWITLPTIYEIPSPVTELWAKYNFTGNNSYAVVQWIPGEDRSCYYFFVYHSDDEQDNYYIKDPKMLFETVINDIKYDQNYTIKVSATNSLDKEGQETGINMQTPSCLDIHQDLLICPPDMPDNLTVKEVPSSENLSYYTLKISWSKPKYKPDYYGVEFMSYPPDVIKTLNVTGESTSVEIENVKILHFYQVAVEAWSLAGTSETAIYSGAIDHTKQIITPKHSVLLIALISMGVFLLIASCAGSSIYANYRIERKRRGQQRRQYFKDLEQKSLPAENTKPYHHEMQDLGDEWMIDPKNITLKKVLGQGSFGVVKYGLLTKGKSQIEVAVKSLKNSPTREELGHFQHEVEIMKSVGSHSHLVSLIGVCLLENYGPMLVVEYCSKGDLQNYLKSIWEKIMNRSVALMEISKQANKTAREFENRLYDLEPMDLQENELINPKELLSFARQVAKGMEYLAKLKILHRDLAARNVLLCEDRTVKVSDFGLSRDVYQDSVYQKKAGGRLPIRWMAIESLTHQQYTTQSDVWSFGILLWEIVTLGGDPYPGIPTENLLKLLKAGYRMDCPINCSQEMYDIMVACWKTNPKDRLTFTEIRIAIENLLESETEYLQVDVNTCVEMNSLQVNSYKNVKPEKSLFERYVKPIWR